MTMQDAAQTWIRAFVDEHKRLAGGSGQGDEALAETAELAFYRTDGGFRAPEDAAAVFWRGSKQGTVRTPWMLDLLAVRAHTERSA